MDFVVQAKYNDEREDLNTVSLMTKANQWLDRYDKDEPMTPHRVISRERVERVVRTGKTMKNAGEIHIEGRLWFDSRAGNTYFTYTISYYNGVSWETVHETRGAKEMEYGY